MADVTLAELERAALSYLNRFDSSAKNLRRVLFGVVRRAEKLGPVDRDQAARLIDQLIERYQASGLIDDRRYAETMARSLRTRGTSARAIRFKLSGRGIDANDGAEALASIDGDAPDAELEAARALVRRRRLGPYRPADERSARRQRDLGALARAGFSLDVARRALECEADELNPDD